MIKMEGTPLSLSDEEDCEKSEKTQQIKEDEPMELAGSELVKPVDLSNNNNNNNNNNNSVPTCVGANNNHNHHHHHHSNHQQQQINGAPLGGGSGSNNSTSSCNLSTGVTRLEGVNPMRKLAFSVENILDPNKFTGKPNSLVAVSKNLFPAELLSHQQTSNFRFAFKDVHGTSTSLRFTAIPFIYL